MREQPIRELHALSLHSQSFPGTIEFNENSTCWPEHIILETVSYFAFLSGYHHPFPYNRLSDTTDSNPRGIPLYENFGARDFLAENTDVETRGVMHGWACEN